MGNLDPPDRGHIPLAVRLQLIFILAGLSLPGCLPAPDCELPAGMQPDPPANAGCLVRMSDRMLLVRDRKTARYSLPGGTSEDREPAQCTAQRETWEESGLRVQVGDLLARLDNEFHIYACTPLAGDIDVETALSPTLGSWLEIERADWLRPADLAASAWRYPQYTPDMLQIFRQLDPAP